MISSGFACPTAVGQNRFWENSRPFSWALKHPPNCIILRRIPASGCYIVGRGSAAYESWRPQGSNRPRRNVFLSLWLVSVDVPSSHSRFMGNYDPYRWLEKTASLIPDRRLPQVPSIGHGTWDKVLKSTYFFLTIACLIYL